MRFSKEQALFSPTSSQDFYTVITPSQSINMVDQPDLINQGEIFLSTEGSETPSHATQEFPHLFPKEEIESHHSSSDEYHSALSDSDENLEFTPYVPTREGSSNPNPESHTPPVEHNLREFSEQTVGTIPVFIETNNHDLDPVVMSAPSIQIPLPTLPPENPSEPTFLKRLKVGSMHIYVQDYSKERDPLSEDYFEISRASSENHNPQPPSREISTPTAEEIIPLHFDRDIHVISHTVNQSSFSIGDLVTMDNQAFRYVSSGLKGVHVGPFEIIAREPDDTYWICSTTGVNFARRIHQNFLKLYHPNVP